MIEYEELDPPHPNGYKYRLTKSYHHTLTHFEPKGRGALGPWVALDHNYLFIREDYMWDGATGPAVDTESFMRASICHDALYQLIAHGILPKKPWKRHADNELVRVAKLDGMPWYRRVWVWLAVRAFGGADGRYRPSSV